MITSPLADHGEGVIWDPAAGLVRWVDMFAGDVLSMPPDGGSIGRIHMGNVVAAMRPRRDGGLVLALERSFALLDEGATAARNLVDVWSDSTVRMNDGGCDPFGRFYCGSMAYDGSRGRGALYRLEPDHTVAVALEPVTVSNGLVWSLDGSTAYYVDSATQRIDAFDYDGDTGRLANRRQVVTIPRDEGTPDGITIDADGHLWIALWGGHAVRRYSPTGRLEMEIFVPARQVTACAFGGPELDALYITTSAHGLDRVDPHAGALYRCRPGVHGVPPPTFAG